MKKLASIFSVISILGLFSSFSLHTESVSEDNYMINEACPCKNKGVKKERKRRVPAKPPTQSVPPQSLIS
jgi:hypothetical protein